MNFAHSATIMHNYASHTISLGLDSFFISVYNEIGLLNI